MLKQVSLFLENKPGRLAHVCRVMAQENINIRALSIADTTDFGVLRLIVDNPELAEEKLKARGFLVSITDVVGIKVADRPGGLVAALDQLEKENISVEYMYAFLGKCGDQAMVILRLNDNAGAVEVIKKSDLEFMTPEEVYQS
jgi:hypothetical protein